MTHSRRPNCILTALFLTSLGLLAGCGGSQSGGGGQAGGAPGGGMPAMPVQVLSAAPQPVADTSTYVASIQSLSSTVISPQVDGIIRKIDVQSGDHVRQGQTLIEIDSSVQQAAVANLEQMRAAQQATLSYARQQLQRSQSLYQEKIGTLQDYQQAQSAANAAEAQLSSLDAQIRQAKVTLGYYNVDAPRAGTVGDIPVRVGDRVAPGDKLTTLDSAQGMQLYVQVPVEQAARLHTGVPVEVLGGNGTLLARSSIFFVSPQVDPTTQTILAKAALNGPEAEKLRTQQYVQARLTWGSHPGMVVPVLAVVQEGASAFLDLATPHGNGFMVHQQAVTLGGITGNNVEVTSGLKAGDKVIVSTHQILQEGMPVIPMPAGGPPAGGGKPSGGGK
ncbi:MAG TPA: efflux RND transporter periplasmic adaptor subunit [Terriglobales bacterium]|nr:efflux RND transporter periplasmic adaptor subunit [Terriglobales bacterium]